MNGVVRSDLPFLHWLVTGARARAPTICRRLSEMVLIISAFISWIARTQRRRALFLAVRWSDWLCALYPICQSLFDAR
jgi:hypothetical protein